MELVLNAHVEEENLVTVVTAEVVELAHVGQRTHLGAESGQAQLATFILFDEDTLH